MKLPRHAEIWLAPYLKDRLRRAVRPAKPKRAWVAITDHYEPLGAGASVETALGRVAKWRDKWPRIADDAPRDAAGRRPQYSFFYPQEEYRRDLLEGIAEMVRLGVGDVEVHLHHDNEQRESFIRKVTEFCRRLTDDHGLASPAGRPHRLRFHSWQLGARQLTPGWKVVRPQRRNRPAARSGLLRRFHHAVAAFGDPGARGQPDLLVHEQLRQSPAVVRSRNRSHGWWWQHAEIC